MKIICIKVPKFLSAVLKLILGKKICANFLNFSLDKMRGLVV